MRAASKLGGLPGGRPHPIQPAGPCGFCSAWVPRSAMLWGPGKQLETQSPALPWLLQLPPSLWADPPPGPCPSEGSPRPACLLIHSVREGHSVPQGSEGDGHNPPCGWMLCGGRWAGTHAGLICLLPCPGATQLLECQGPWRTQRLLLCCSLGQESLRDSGSG